MNAEQLIKLINNIFPSQYRDENGKPLLHYVDRLLGDVEKIEMIQVCKEEPNSSDFRTVVFFPEHNIYLSQTGWYDSFFGSTYSHLIKQVVPVTKTIINYEDVE